MDKINIAVDGPAGSGKSTVSKKIAKELDIVYVDTGAMYRSIAYFALQEKVSLDDEEKIVSLLKNINLKIVPNKDGQKIFIDSVDVTEKIRTQEIGLSASIIAQYEKVRVYLGDIQKNMANEISVIMDGRDIGTNILPNAQVKIYLDADVLERANRRLEELKLKGAKDNEIDMKAIEEEIISRDKNDMERVLNPLVKAEDAILLDTTGLSIDDVVNRILEIIKNTVVKNK